jgi:hypothetical protein
LIVCIGATLPLPTIPASTTSKRKHANGVDAIMADNPRQHELIMDTTTCPSQWQRQWDTWTKAARTSAAPNFFEQNKQKMRMDG